MKKFFILIFIGFVFVSAKDKESSNSFKTNSLFPIDTAIYANLQVTTTLTDMGALGKYYDSNITASFFDGITRAVVPVTNVKYNGHYFYRDTILGGNYFDTSGTQPIIGQVWEVTGLGNIPSFSFQPTNPAPNYTDFTLLPDTIDSAFDLALPLTGINNATHVFVTLNDGGSNKLIEGINLVSPTQSRLTSNANVGVNSITIQSTDLNTLSATNTGNLMVMVSNTDIQIIGGKRIAFTHTFFYLKNNFTIQ